MMLSTSTLLLVQKLFPESLDASDKKRPETCGSQFRTAMGKLIDTLLICQPHYVRCIKPNDQKKSRLMDEERTRHQIRYLGLVENVRVRRAGFANRQDYPRFLQRYKMTTKSTWPLWHKDSRKGVEEILNNFKIKATEFRLGKTKVFIKNPKTLFFFEEKRVEFLPKLVTKIQAVWRGWFQKNHYKKTRAAMKIQAQWRGYLQRDAFKRTKASILIQAIWRGHKQKKLWIKKKAALKLSLFWQKYQARKYSSALAVAFKNLSTDIWLGKHVEWPKVSSILRRAEGYIKRIHSRWRIWKMVYFLSEEEKALLKQKFVTYDIFHGKKYWDCNRMFLADYLDTSDNLAQKKYIDTMQKMFLSGGDSQVLFADHVIKINSKNKSQSRALVVTDAHIYKQDPKNHKMTKGGIPLSTIKSIWLTSNKDTYCLVKIDPESNNPDVLVDLGVTGKEKVSEFVTVIVQQCKDIFGVEVSVNFSETWTYNNSRRKGNQGKDQQLALLPEDSVKVCTFKKGKDKNKVFYPPGGVATSYTAPVDGPSPISSPQLQRGAQLKTRSNTISNPPTLGDTINRGTGRKGTLDGTSSAPFADKI